MFAHLSRSFPVDTVSATTTRARVRASMDEGCNCHFESAVAGSCREHKQKQPL